MKVVEENVFKIIDKNGKEVEFEVLFIPKALNVFGPAIPSTAKPFLD